MDETRIHLAEFASGIAHPTERLREVTEQLIGLHRRLALLLEAEVNGKAQAYMQSTETTISGREREGSVTMSGITGDIFITKGEIAAYTEERDFLRLLMADA